MGDQVLRQLLRLAKVFGCVTVAELLLHCEKKFAGFGRLHNPRRLMLNHNHFHEFAFWLFVSVTARVRWWVMLSRCRGRFNARFFCSVMRFCFWISIRFC